MSDQNNLTIQFRISRIETLQFALLQESLTADKLSYSVNFGYGIDAENQLVRSTFRYELLGEAKSCLIIEIAVDFAIEQKCFEEHFHKDGKLFIESSFAAHLAMIAVGTARGILHEKTKDTVYNSFLIPTIDVKSQIVEDITFDAE